MPSAAFRIDQVTPGAGTSGRSRHDLVAGEVITLVATSPTGPGVTYAWEILDKVGSNATLSASTGTTVTIGNAGAIVAPCGFLIRLTVNDNGVVLVTERECTVRAPVTGLRPLLFTERAPTANRFSSNDPDLSTDNAQYADLAGTGISGQNWRGYAQPYWELLQVIEGLSGGGFFPTGPAGGDLAGTYPNPTVDGLRGRTVAATAPADGQMLMWHAASSQWRPGNAEAISILRTVGYDDFTDHPSLGWTWEAANGATLLWGDNAAKRGLAGAGFVGLSCSTAPGSAIQAFRKRTGLVHDTGKPIVIDWQITVANGSEVVSDDECEWVVGIAGADGLDGDAVVLQGALDSGRVHNLMIVTAGTPAATEVTMPTLGAGQSYRVRLTVAPGSVVLEAAVDADNLVEIVEVTATVPAGVYHPFAYCGKSSGAGDRTLIAGFVAWDAARVVAESAAGGDVDDENASPLVEEADLAAYVPTARTVTTTAPLTIDGGASANLSANRTLAISAASTSAPGAVELATDAETQTGADTARAVTPAGLAATSVPLGRTLTTTAPLTIDGGASATLGADRTLAISAATTSAQGAVELATSAETTTGTDTDRAVTPAGLAATSVPLARTLTTTAPLTIGGGASADLSANRTLAISAATTSAQGAVELATSAEAITGTDTDRAVTPKALADTLQPGGRTVSGTTDNITSADIGNIVFYSQAGGVEAELPDLSASLISGRALVLTLQGTNAATVITVDPGASVTIDGAATNFVALTGKSRISLISLDGLAWYSGTP